MFALAWMFAAGILGIAVLDFIIVVWSGRRRKSERRLDQYVGQARAAEPTENGEVAKARPLYIDEVWDRR